MFKHVKSIQGNNRGDTSTVFKMVLTITVIAAVLVIILFILQSAQLGGSKLTTAMNDTAGQITSNLTNFSKTN
jgi:uncharacterized protein (UPF0333 family)